MSTIVKKHYPAGRLPPELRVGLPKDSKVHIKIVTERPAAGTALAKLVGTARNVHGDEQDVLDAIAEARAER